MRTGAARVTGRALWIRRVSKKGIVFHSLRHTMATLLARAKMHPSVTQKSLRHANIETTLAIGSESTQLCKCTLRRLIASLAGRQRNAAGQTHRVPV